MITWLQALHGGKVLTPKSYVEMITPSTLDDGTPLRYSMGLFVGEDSRGLRQIGHDGGGFGFGAVANWYPDAQLAVVVLTNSQPTAIRVVTDDLGAAVLPVPRPTGPFTGDASLLVGTYKGLGRGKDMVIQVTQTPQGIAFAFDGAAASPLPWVEGWTFRETSSPSALAHLPPEHEQWSRYGTAVRQGRWPLHPQAPVEASMEYKIGGVSNVRSTRWRAEAALAVLFAVVMLVVGGGAVWLASTKAVHEDAAAVPSTAAAAPAEGHSDAVEEGRRLARSLVVNENLPGLSVAVAVDGETVWAEGFGWADVDSRTPVTPLTRFRLGALSKPLTAVAAALLHDRGRLDLDAPVQRYVPAYPAKQWTVTTRQLMGDVAGVHRIRGDNNDAMPVRHCASLDEAVAMLADDPLLFEPGTEHRYSIWGWVLVSAVVEGAAGEPFTGFMVRQVFEPLALERTVVAETAGLDGVAHRAGRRPDYSCVAGAGAFLSTPTDLVRLGSAMLKPGLLQAETIAALQTPTRLVSGASTTYALGWTVGSVQLAGEPARIVSHRGSPSGGTVSLLTFPDLGLAIAAAANVTDARGVHPFALQVAEAFTRHQNRQALPPRTGTTSEIVSSSP